MAKKYSSKDLFQGSLFGEQTQEAEAFLMVLKDVIKSFQSYAKLAEKTIIQTNEETSEGMEQVNKQYEESVQNTDALKKAKEEEAKETKKLNKLKDEEAKIRDKIAKAQTEEGKKLFKLRAELNKVNKEQRDAAKASLEQFDAYRALTVQTNEAQANFKKLAAEFGVSSKEAQEAQKKFEKLDKELREINEEAKDGRRDVGRYRQEVSKLADEMKKAAKDGSGFGDVLDKVTSPVGILTSAATGLGAAFLATEKGGNKAKDVLAQLKGGFNAVTASVGGFVNSLIEGDDVSDAYSKNLDGLTDKVVEQSEALKEATQAQRQNRIDLRESSAELAVLRGEYELLSQRAGDATTTLEKQQEATIEQAKKAAQITNQELVVIDKEIDAINLQIEARKELNNADLLDERQELINQQLELEGQLSAELAAIGQERRQIEQDQFEQRLDFLFDTSDRQKSITEKQIDDESRSTEERLKLFDDLSKGIKKTYAEIENEFQQASGQQIKIAEFAQLEATEQAKLLNTLNLSEIERNRLKEAVVEYLQVVQDLEETQADLNDVEEQSLSLQNQIEIQRNKLADNSIDIEKELTELRKRELREQIKNLDENSIERLKKEKELNDLLIKEKENLAKKEKKSNEDNEKELKKSLERRKEIEQALFDSLNNQLDSYYEKKFQAIDNDIAKSEDAEDKLIAAQEKGVANSEKSIAFQRQQQAELEAEKIRLAEEQARRELVLASFEAYRANDGNLAKTFTDIIALKEFANTVPILSAFDGTEDTGAGGSLDSKGGFHAILHPHERVLTAKQNKVVGDLTNEELTSVAQMYHQGAFVVNNQGSLDYRDDFKKLTKEIKDLPKRMPQNFLQYDPIRKVLKDTLIEGNKTVNRIHKANRLL